MQDIVEIKANSAYVRRGGSTLLLSGGSFTQKEGVVFRNGKPCIVIGSGKVALRNLDLAHVRKIVLTGPLTARARANAAPSGTVRGDAALLSLIRLQVIGETLQIGPPDGLIVQTKIPLELSLSLTELASVTARKSVRLTIDSIQSRALSVIASEYSAVRLRGSSQDLTILADKSSQVLAQSLSCKRATVTSSVYSLVKVAPSFRLSATANQGARILYFGSPKTVEAQTGTYSSIKKAAR